jgi:hypothetical protein
MEDTASPHSRPPRPVASVLVPVALQGVLPRRSRTTLPHTRARPKYRDRRRLPTSSSKTAT